MNSDEVGKIKAKMVFVFLLTFLFFSLNFISSEPLRFEFDSGYQIADSQTNIIKLYEDFKYDFFVYNISNGVPLNKSFVNCTFYIADSSGELIVTGNPDYLAADYWEINISGNNFSEIGTYNYGTKCEGNNNGGTTIGTIEVTPSGFTGTLGFFFVILALSLGIVIVGFYMEDPIITILGSFGLFFLGLYILFNGIADMKDTVTTWSSGIITLGLAFYVSVRSTYEIITDSGQ